MVMHARAFICLDTGSADFTQLLTPPVRWTYEFMHELCMTEILRPLTFFSTVGLLLSKL